MKSVKCCVVNSRYYISVSNKLRIARDNPLYLKKCIYKSRREEIRVSKYNTPTTERIKFLRYKDRLPLKVARRRINM